MSLEFPNYPFNCEVQGTLSASQAKFVATLNGYNLDTLGRHSPISISSKTKTLACAVI